MRKYRDPFEQFEQVEALDEMVRVGGETFIAMALQRFARALSEKGDREAESPASGSPLYAHALRLHAAATLLRQREEAARQAALGRFLCESCELPRASQPGNACTNPQGHLPMWSVDENNERFPPRYGDPEVYTAILASRLYGLPWFVEAHLERGAEETDRKIVLTVTAVPHPPIPPTFRGIPVRWEVRRS